MAQVFVTVSDWNQQDKVTGKPPPLQRFDILPSLVDDLVKFLKYAEKQRVVHEKMEAHDDVQA